MSSKKPDAAFYKHLYSTTDYGQFKFDRCPGVRFFTEYRSHLIDPIIDLGAGNGDTVSYLRRHGFQCYGIDFSGANRSLICDDITRPLCLRNYKTALCIDVLEHLEEEDVFKAMDNIQQCEHAIVSVSCDSDVVEGVELHLTRWPIHQWTGFFNSRMDLVRMWSYTPNRALYLLKKPSSVESEDGKEEKT